MWQHKINGISCAQCTTSFSRYSSMEKSNCLLRYYDEMELGYEFERRTIVHLLLVLLLGISSCFEGHAGRRTGEGLNPLPVLLWMCNIHICASTENSHMTDEAKKGDILEAILEGFFTLCVFSWSHLGSISWFVCNGSFRKCFSFDVDL